ncbi:hypothetical protein ACIA5D_16010 [Actinoplanes sp. NPDC051513]|uniref:hypothetical protein n=1 Tax=Actinoplanes sp. NPDC051513 TaxID=3363908 RepID=UPI00379D3CE5
MRIRRIVGAVALTVATAISFVLPATTASAAAGTATLTVEAAAGSCGHAVFSPDGGAMACFNPTGEHLFVCDTDADGHHPGAWYLLTAGINWHNVQYDLGAGDCHDLNLDMAESAYIQYQACNYEGSAELSCSSYALAPAKG